MTCASFSLPDVIDAASAPALRSALLDRRGADLEVDASAVRRIGALGLQILLATSRQWRADGAHLAIVNASDAFIDLTRLMGAADLPELSA
jgi:chemotaxis protein CheX